MVAIWDVERLPQVRDGGEEFIGVDGMPLNNLPFVWSQWAGLQQDGVGDCHLADIVQECAPVHVDEISLGDTE